MARLALRFALAAALVAVLLGGSVAQSDDPAPTPAHLIVHKSVAEPRLVVGRNMTIKISVHNAGETAATDVRVADPGWESEHFDVLGPATSATFAAVAPGATELLEFVVVPKVDGRFSAGPSLATYDAGAGASGGARSGVSNALPAIPILSEFERTVAEALEVGEKLTFGVYKTIEDWTRGATVFAGICVLFFGNWLALRGKKAVSAARSARAMEELLKMDEKKKE